MRDVTEHPAFRNSARSVARLYDALHDPKTRGNQEQMRLDMARFSGGRGILDECDALVEQCLTEYDLDGWTGDT